MSKLKRNIVCVALFLMATVLSLCGVLVLDKTVSASAATPTGYTQTGNVEATETWDTLVGVNENVTLTETL